MDSTIINELEWEYARKAFNNDKTILGKMQVEKAHDPFGTLSEEEKTNLFISGAIKKEDYIVSVYITYFIERALQEYNDFLEMDYKKQNDVLMGYTKEKMATASMEIKKAIVNDVTSVNRMNNEE
jgi:hypothetical protein